MPNFDGGHYFYTGLFPVRLGPIPRADGSITVPSHLLRETLASLPNYSQMPDAIRTSPFARCRSTHFARLCVIDDPAFNGRDPEDALLQAVKGVDLHDHQPVDHLSRAWLLFTADFDAADESARDRWAAGLWRLMEAELSAVFEHCEDFSRVTDGKAFAAYLAQGQIETTMSFNDYWIDPMAVPTLSLARVGLTALGVLLIFLAAAWLIDRQFALGWPLWLGAALLGIGAAIWTAYKVVMRFGAKPFPTAPDSDLKSVLKSLHLQQHFVRFAIAQQGAPPQQLYDAFARFVAESRPDDVDAPTQPPGVLAR